MATYIQCPHCGANLSVPEEYKNDKRLHCSKCDKVFDNPIHLVKQKVTKQHTENKASTGWTKKQKRGLWVLGICICIMLYHCGAFKSIGTPQIGDKVVIVNNTWGTLDKDDDDLGSAMMAEDAIGLYEQTSSGKAKHIWKGSHGKVIHGSWTKIQVRFDDGSLWWVSTDAVKKE